MLILVATYGTLFCNIKQAELDLNFLGTIPIFTGLWWLVKEFVTHASKLSFVLLSDFLGLPNYSKRILQLPFQL